MPRILRNISIATCLLVAFSYAQTASAQTASRVGNTLTVTGSSGDDNLIIFRIPASPYVTVYIEDAYTKNILYVAQHGLASTLDEVVLVGGDGEDDFDLSFMGANDFPSLGFGGIVAFGGNNGDYCYGSPYYSEALFGGGGNDDADNHCDFFFE